MTKVAIVTDSTATIPTELLGSYPVQVVPLQVIWGDETFLDGLDIQPADFYQRLKHTKVMPTTSQPSPAAFIKVYQKLLDEGYSILSVHISAALSGTVDSALQAKAHFTNAPIEVVNSQLTSMAMGFPVMLAARAAAQNATLQECRVLVERATEQSGVCFVVNTLEFLHRGGRIGGAAAFLGTALNLKPLLELREGRIEAIERVRTMGKAVDRLIALTEERIGTRTPIRLAALHAHAPAEAQELLARARDRFGLTDVSETFIADISPVLGTHTGPGAMGLAYMAGM